MNVLLVEDEEAIARPLATLLRAEGWTIETAATAARARELAASRAFDAALIGGGILQRLAAMLLQDGDRGLHHLLHGKQLGRGHTAGKGEYVGLRRQLQQLADLGALQQVHSTCKLYHVLFLLKFC